MKHDLHIHSNISDGELSRNDIIKILIQKDIEVVSFTEHNSFVESPKNDQINFINGIEFDTMLEKSFHLLCYFPYYSKNISQLITKYRNNTNDRSNELIKKIGIVHNVNLSIEELVSFFNRSYITKRDIIDWIIFNGYAKSVTEAVEIFTGKNAPSYVPKFSLDFQEVVITIKNIGGYVFLAHPVTLKLDDIEFEKFILTLKDNGLDGIEVINLSKITDVEMKKLKYIADKLELLTCGGSDFHNVNKHNLGVDGDESDILIKRLIK